MDSLVPSYVSIAGVDFPLEANVSSVGLATGVPELEPLRYAIDEVVNGDFKDLDVDVLAREGFTEQGVSMRPIRIGREIADGPINWRRVSGAWPDISDAFLVRTSFIPLDLVVPRPVVVALVLQLRALRHDVLAGLREGRIDEVAVPLPRPLTPELEEYARLRSESQEAAEKYREELYARRG